VQIAPSTELRRGLQEDELDVIVAARGGSPQPVLRCEQMVWIGERRLARQEEVPLVLVNRPCPFADAALAALDGAGRRHRIVLRTPSLSGVRAAVRAGLGIGCRTRLLSAGEMTLLGAADGLPELPAVDYILLRRNRLSAAAEALCDIVTRTLQPPQAIRS
jgi:DNA-binding transcriptional LysR family regulator